MAKLLKIILIYILFLVGVTIYALFSSFIYTTIQINLAHEENYIIFIPNTILMIISVILPIIILIVIKFLSDIRNKKLKHLAYIILLLATISFYSHSLTNYSMVKQDKIVVNNLFNKKEFTYTDIEEAKVGVYETGRYKKGSFYYILTLKDGRTIDLSDSTGGEYDPYESIQLIDNIIKNYDIKKIIDKESITTLPSDFDEAVVDIIKELMELDE